MKFKINLHRMIGPLPISGIVLVGLLFVTLCSEAVADSAERIFSTYKNSIVQIRIIDRGSSSKSTIGSGFTIGSGNLVVSNYHVVAELVSRAKNYRAELIDASGESHQLSLLAVDVVHDLALLRLDKPLATALSLADVETAMGEELFAFGNPLDLGLTIVTGTYNGLLEKSLYDKIHFTGSINPGMSGGPTINRAGVVVGVNVATAGNQISFLVPASYVQKLVADAPETPPAADELTSSVRDQLLANQAVYMSDLQASPFASVPIGDFNLPGELAHYIRCWGDTPELPDALYDKVYKACSSNDAIFLTRQQRTGMISFRHELFSTEELGPVRFYRFLDNHFPGVHFSFGGNEEDFTNFACQTDLVDTESIEAKVVFCLRGYKKYQGLYDVFVSAMTLMDNSEALHTSLKLTGVSEENARHFSRTYLESIQWK